MCSFCVLFFLLARAFPFHRNNSAQMARKASRSAVFVSLCEEFTSSDAQSLNLKKPLVCLTRLAQRCLDFFCDLYRGQAVVWIMSLSAKCDSFPLITSRERQREATRWIRARRKAAVTRRNVTISGGGFFFPSWIIPVRTICFCLFRFCKKIIHSTETRRDCGI